jgi:hypothetical protein
VSSAGKNFAAHLSQEPATVSLNVSCSLNRSNSAEVGNFVNGLVPGNRAPLFLQGSLHQRGVINKGGRIRPLMRWLFGSYPRCDQSQFYRGAQ